MSTTNKIVINSAILYIKTIVTVIVSILYSRYLLVGLGIEDYGIYNLVGGVIGMMGFVTATLSNSGTRFIATSLGENDIEKTRSIFVSVLDVVNKTVWVLVIGLEVVGVILINYVLKIPAERLMAANIVYQFMVLNSVYNILIAPYSGLLFSREKIVFISILDIINVLVKIGIVFIILYSNTDKLILYGFLLFLLSFIHRSVLKYYCKKTDIIFNKKFDDKRFVVNKELNARLLSFSGWNLMGSLGIIVTRQGRIFLINIFFGVILNATLGIATVVNTQLSNFSSSLLRALQPQIFKSFGKGDKTRQEFLTFVTSKMGIILISFVVIPLFLEIDYILKIWLVEIPEFTAIFIRLGLLLTILGHMSYGLTISMQAHGRIKELQITTFLLQLLNFPISYTLYKIGYPVYYTFIVAIFLELIIFGFRMYFARKFINLNVIKFFNKIIIVPILMLITSIGIIFLLTNKMNPSLIRIITVFIINIFFVSFFSYFIILNEQERIIINGFIKSIKNRLIKG